MIVPGMTTLLSELNSEVTALESEVSSSSKISWQQLITPLEKISDRNQRAWGTVSHLKGVKDSDGLRKSYEVMQPEIVKFGQRLSQSKSLYSAFSKLKEDAGIWNSLTRDQKRIVDMELRDFVLGGVGLEGEQKERFNLIAQELAQLSTKFSNNVLDSTKAFKKLVTDIKEVTLTPQRHSPLPLTPPLPSPLLTSLTHPSY